MKPLEESNVAVVGLGLMGASLAWKLRGDGVAGKVWGVVHRQETGRKAMERGLVDAIVPWEEALSADAMVLAAPVRVIGSNCAPWRRLPVAPAWWWTWEAPSGRSSGRWTPCRRTRWP